MSHKDLLRQKKLMGILTENSSTDPYQTSEVPVTLIKKLDDVRSHLFAAIDHSELALRGLHKSLKKTKDIDNASNSSLEAFQAESKSLMNLVRTNIDAIDRAQARAYDCLKELDYLIGSVG
jgi:hypothetical protein